MNLVEALNVGFNMEVDWNVERNMMGHSFALIEVPPVRYRIGRALHMGGMVVRENIALAIAPWLEPPVLP